MATTTPLLVLTLWDAGILQPDLIFNDALRKMDVLIGGIVLSRTTDAEPGAPAEGDAYIITGAATGTDWATFAQNDIAVYSGATWVNYAPLGRINMMVDDETDLIIFWDGAAWSTTGISLTAADIDTLAKLNAIVTDATLVDTADIVLVADTDASGYSFYIDEDNMVSDLPTKFPSQQSVKKYVDDSVVGLLDHKGGYDAATNTPDLDTAPAGILQGDAYVVTAPGAFFAVNVAAGDWMYALQDNPTTAAHWTIVEVNQDAASIKVLYESNADTNEFSDAEQTKLTNAIEDTLFDANTILAADADDVPAAVTVPEQTLVGRITAGNIVALTIAQVLTLLGIEAGSTADQSDSEIKTAYENNADTNEYSDAEQTTVLSVENGATADQSDAEIKTAYENNADTNEFSDAEQTKLGIAIENDGTTPFIAGSAAGAVAMSFGDDATEGYEIVVVDETVSGLVAVSTDLTADIPIGAYILSVQGNIETLVVAGGTSVKVGIGPVADPDKYGITSAFTKNLKIDTIPVHAVLSGAEDVQINMCATGGGIGDTVASAGAVRVRIVYALPNSLVDAV